MTSTEFQALKQSILDDVRVMMQTTGQVTQYIGARYVPLISDPIEWDVNKEYEPLTIVTNQGNSYTSRQFVPKGIPITNTQFWASTGNFNAQIEQYRKEVEKFDSRITAAQNTADSKAPINHATDSTEYGVGNAANYGHVKLASDDTPVDSDANSGIAATPKTVSKYISDNSIYKSIEEFGVSTGGDPVTNRNNLQAALDAVAGKNVVLIVPKGTYSISDYVEIGNDTHIIGVSQGDSVIRCMHNTHGVFMSKLDAVNNVHVTAGSTIANMRLMGSYWTNMGTHDRVPYTPDKTVKPTTRCLEAGLSVFNIGSKIEKLTIHGFPVGLHTYSGTPSTGTAEKVYSVRYGDVRTTNQISVHHCYVGLSLREIDSLATDLRVYNTYDLGTVDAGLINLHTWIWTAGLEIGGGYFYNGEIEGQEDISPIDNPLTEWGPWLYCWPGAYSNIRMWNFDYYRPFAEGTLQQKEIIKLHRGFYSFNGLRIAPIVPPDEDAESFPTATPLIFKCDSQDAIGTVEGCVGFKNTTSLRFLGTAFTSLMRCYANPDKAPSTQGWQANGIPTLQKS